MFDTHSWYVVQFTDSSHTLAARTKGSHMSQPSVKKLRLALDGLEATMADPLSTSEQVNAAEAAVTQLFGDLEVLLDEARTRFTELMAQNAGDEPSSRLERLRAYLHQVFAVDEPLVVSSQDAD